MVRIAAVGLLMSLVFVSGCLRLVDEGEESLVMDHGFQPGPTHEPEPVGEGQACSADGIGYLPACRGELRCLGGRCRRDGCERDDECGLYACNTLSFTCETSCLLFGVRGCAAGAVCRAGRCADARCDAENAATQCAGFACKGGACAGVCSTNADCHVGFLCSGLRCVPGCTQDNAARCGAYACDARTGRCGDHCTGTSGCAPGHVCNGNLTCTRDPEAIPCSAEDEAQICGASRCITPPGTCSPHCSDDQGCVAGARCAPAPCRLDLLSCYDRPMVCQTTCSAARDPVCGNYGCDTTRALCEVTCDETRPCAPYARCNAQNACEPDPAARPCSASGECALYACDLQRGFCVGTCIGDGDCAEGAACDEGRCRRTCTDQNAATVCSAYGCDTSSSPALCLDSCEQNSDCARGFSCEAGSCRGNPACSGPNGGECGSYQCDVSALRCMSWCRTAMDCSFSARCGFDGSCYY